MNKKCDICGVMFEASRSNQKRCGNKCSQKARSQNNAGNVKKRRLKALGLVREFLGEKCVVCGYNTSSWALEAHHIDPKTKEFPLGSCLTRSLDKLLEEAKKCVLLCANCHREHHHGLIKTDTLIEILQKEQPFRKKWLENLHKQRLKISNKCIICKKNIDHQAKRCVPCSNKHREKITWPPTAELIKMVGDTSFSAVGRELGVSDNGVRKRIKTHSI